MSFRRSAGIVLLDRRILTVDLDFSDIQKIETGTVHSTARFLTAFGATSLWLQGHYTIAFDIRDRVALPCVYYLPMIRSLWVAADGLTFVELAGDLLGSRNPEFYQLTPAVADRFFAQAGIVNPTSMPPPKAAHMPEPSGQSDDPAAMADDPVNRVVAAGYALQKAGKRVTARAACAAAVPPVERKSLAKRHPEVIKLLNILDTPDRNPRKGAKDRRTGNIEAVDNSDDD